MNQYIGKRILFTVGDNDAPRQACVQMVSPNGKYARMGGDTVWDEPMGWLPVSSLSVVEVLGDEREPLSQIIKRSIALGVARTP